MNGTWKHFAYSSENPQTATSSPSSCTAPSATFVDISVFDWCHIEFCNSVILFCCFKFLSCLWSGASQEAEAWAVKIGIAYKKCVQTVTYTHPLGHIHTPTRTHTDTHRYTQTHSHTLAASKKSKHVMVYRGLDYKLLIFILPMYFRNKDNLW